MKDKVIFESEEEFNKFWDDCGQGNMGCADYFMTKKLAKQKGYIRKSSVEEAEEQHFLYRANMGNYTKGIRVQFEKYYEAIQELKRRLNEITSCREIPPETERFE